MSQIRLFATPELAEVLDERFVEICSGGDTGTCATETELLEQFRELAEQHRSKSGESEWNIDVLIVTRAFEELSVQTTLAMLKTMDSFCERWPLLTCSVSVEVLLPGFLQNPDAATEDAARKLARQTMTDLLAAEKGLSRLRGGVEVWLVDGIDSTGTRAPESLNAPLLAEFIDSSPRLDPMCGNFVIAGIRGLLFPRTAIQWHLADWYALAVLEHESWLAGGVDLQYSWAAMECGDFVDVTVLPGIDRIDKDDANRPVEPLMSMPAVQATEPLSTVMRRLEEPVDIALEKDLERVGAVLNANQGRLQTELAKGIAAKVASLVDTAKGRVTAARAFLEVLLNSSSELVRGEVLDAGRPRTLSAAFAPSISFLDVETGFDSSARQGLEDAKAMARRQDQHIAELNEELARFESGQATTPSAKSRVEALEAALEVAAAGLEETISRRDELETIVSCQDLALENPATREAMWPAVLENVEARIAAAATTLAAKKAACEEALANLAVAEEEARSLAIRLVVRFLIALAVAIVGAIGVGVAVAPAMAAVPVAGALAFGLFGGVATAIALQIYLAVAVIGLIILGIVLLMKYFGSLGAVEKARKAVQSAEAIFVIGMREYWNAYLDKFSKRCQWIRSSRVFETERYVRSYVEDQLLARLEQFSEALARELETVRQSVADFEPPMSEREVSVVSREFIGELLSQKRGEIEARSSKFLSVPEPGAEPDSTRGLSRYWLGFCDTGGLDVFWADLANQCSNDIFWELRQTTICDVLKQLAARFDAAAVASNTPLLVPLMPDTKLSGTWVVAGPEQSCIESLADKLPERGATLLTEDEERIWIYRVCSDIDASSVVGLHEVG